MASLNIGMLKLNKVCDVAILHDMHNILPGYYLNLGDLEWQASE